MALHARSPLASATALPARRLAAIFAAGAILAAILAESSAEAQYNTAAFAPWQQPPGRAAASAAGQNWSGRTGAPSGNRVRQPAQTRPPYAQDQQPGRPENPPVRQTGFDAAAEAAPANAPSQQAGSAPQAETIPRGEIVNDGGGAPAGWGPPGGGGGNCGDGGGGPCEGGWCEGGPGGMYYGPCTPFAGRLWVRGQYLLWWTQGMDVPPLVTTSPAGTNRNAAGRLDQPTTTILFGNHRLNSEARSGGRFTVGWWLDPCESVGLEGTYLTLGRKTTEFRADSNTFAILGRPFGNVESRTDFQDAGLIAFPNVATGSVNANATTDFQTVEVLLRRALIEQCQSRIDFLIGYRYALLESNLRVNEFTTSIDQESVTPVGTTFDVFDQFDTANQFHGADLGIAFHEQCCRWSLDLLMKLALGSTRSRAIVDGGTTITFPQTAPSTFAGGFLAQPTNMGKHQQNSFTMIPELGVTLGFDLTCRLRATVGYTLIYWSKVARAGDQIDTELNPSQFPPGTLVGAPHPEFRFRTTDFWAQGMDFGLQYRF